jgi:hypothetical protein
MLTVSRLKTPRLSRPHPVVPLVRRPCAALLAPPTVLASRAATVALQSVATATNGDPCLHQEI